MAYSNHYPNDEYGVVEKTLMAVGFDKGYGVGYTDGVAEASKCALPIWISGLCFGIAGGIQIAEIIIEHEDTICEKMDAASGWMKEKKQKIADKISIFKAKHS